MSRLGFAALFTICIVGLWGTRIASAADAAASSESDAKLYQKTVEKGVEYLINKGQQEDGSYGKAVGPGVAAICTTALLKQGRSRRRSDRGQKLEVPAKVRSPRWRHL